MSTTNICQNINSIKDRIASACLKAGRNPADVQLIAVSKTKPISAILEALKCGHLDFGENRMQELSEKMSTLDDASISWHMIGTLQSNKIRFIAERVDWIHSVGKISHFKEIEKRAKNTNRTINTLIQVNISGESQKDGCEPEEISKILDFTKNLSHVKVCGLMGMATFVDDPELVRPEFQLLNKLFQEHQRYNGGNIQLDQLSMGMSADMEVAIEEGATMVRIGSDIFGSRNYP